MAKRLVGVGSTDIGLTDIDEPAYPDRHKLCWSGKVMTVGGVHPRMRPRAIPRWIATRDAIQDKPVLTNLVGLCQILRGAPGHVLGAWLESAGTCQPHEASDKGEERSPNLFYRHSSPGKPRMEKEQRATKKESGAGRYPFWVLAS